MANAVAASGAGPRSNGTGSAVPVVLMGAGLIVLALLYFFVRPGPQIDNSIIGTRGFAAYAKVNGLDLTVLTRHTEREPADFGLRVLPLYDNDPDTRSFGTLEKNQNRFLVQEMRSISRRVIEHKLRALPTLVVMPKWRAGALHLSKLHPSLLVDASSIGFPHARTDKAPGGKVRLKRGEPRFEALALTYRGTDISGMDGMNSVSVYLPQTLDLPAFRSDNPKACREVIGSAAGTVLARCRIRNDNATHRYWLLSDPDLINNHGLMNGENAAFALALVKALSEGKPVVLDETDEIVLNPPAGRSDTRGRSFDDLLRFFAWPFSLFWIGFGILAMFTLWRAWKRYGPVEDRENETMHAASKATVLSANARILRAGGFSTAMLQAHAKQKLDALGAELLGVSRLPGRKGIDQLIRTVSRRSPELGESIESLHRSVAGAATISGDRAGPWLTEFEQTIEKVRHEFGRTSGTGHPHQG